MNSPAAPSLRVEPIRSADLPAVGSFLHEHLNRRFSPERWIGSLTHRWAPEPPNHGMLLRDGDRLVGVLCAIYSEQTIDGRVERFCNPHSWCVLESHRRHGIGLVLRIIRQPGYHFTMFTPNPKVTEVFRGLKFKDLDDRLLVYANLPSWRAALGAGFATSEPATIETRLTGTALAEYEAHRDIPWLRFTAFGRGSEAVLAIYKPVRLKRLPCAWLMHVSDPAGFERHGALLRHHLLLRHGFAFTRMEQRWLAPLGPGQRRLAMSMRRHQPKLFLSASLGDAQVRDVYSELMSLDV